MGRARRQRVLTFGLVSASLCAWSACTSEAIELDLTDVDPCPGCPEGPAGGPFELPPAVWVAGVVFDGDGAPLTDVRASVSVFADSAGGGPSIATVPVDSTDGDYGFRMDVEDVCGGPTYASAAVFDAGRDSVLSSSGLQWLVAEGVPDGCPFPSAEDVDGVPVDTVVADDIIVSPS
jgi:hypothetical protein